MFPFGSSFSRWLYKWFVPSVWFSVAFVIDWKLGAACNVIFQFFRMNLILRNLQGHRSLQDRRNLQDHLGDHPSRLQRSSFNCVWVGVCVHSKSCELVMSLAICSSVWAFLCLTSLTGIWAIWACWVSAALDPPIFGCFHANLVHLQPPSSTNQGCSGWWFWRRRRASRSAKSRKPSNASKYCG